MPSLFRPTVVLLSLAGLACGTHPATLTGPRVVITPQGLEQSVRLTPAQPAMGDTVAIASIVVNLATGSVDVSSRICGLDLESSLSLANPFGWCAGYSMQGALAPGDTLRGFDRRVVGGVPGTYTLRVRHLLDPDVWVEVPVTVRMP
jgi:hypothetical protein